MKKELESNIESVLLDQLRRGQISRRQFMQTMIVAGLGLSGVRGLAASPSAQDTRPLTPTFYQWMVNLPGRSQPGIWRCELPNRAG